MAKKEDVKITIGGAPKDSGIVIGEELKKKLDDIQEEVVPEIEVVSTKEEPKVKIKAGENHRCCIGGIWYQLEKGKVTLVPAHVKNILLKSGILLPLE